MSVRYLGLLVLLLTGCGATSNLTGGETKPTRYVLQYLMVQRPVDIPTDAKGTTKQFNASQITEGEKLFEDNCKSCHAGGNTLQDPTISLSLLTLKQATPPRDNLAALVSFIQAPRSYDGKAASATCRGGAFLKPEEQEKLAAFILRAADRAQGWATMPKL